jgi:hypothetical protein
MINNSGLYLTAPAKTRQVIHMLRFDDNALWLHLWLKNPTALHK